MYKLLEKRPSEFANALNNEVNQGWEPIGNAFSMAGTPFIYVVLHKGTKVELPDRQPESIPKDTLPKKVRGPRGG
jgi:hypothetical protein